MTPLQIHLGPPAVHSRPNIAPCRRQGDGNQHTRGRARNRLFRDSSEDAVHDSPLRPRKHSMWGEKGRGSFWNMKRPIPRPPSPTQKRMFGPHGGARRSSSAPIRLFTLLTVLDTRMACPSPRLACRWTSRDHRRPWAPSPPPTGHSQTVNRATSSAKRGCSRQSKGSQVRPSPMGGNTDVVQARQVHNWSL